MPREISRAVERTTVVVVAVRTQAQRLPDLKQQRALCPKRDCGKRQVGASHHQWDFNVSTSLVLLSPPPPPPPPSPTRVAAREISRGINSSVAWLSEKFLQAPSVLTLASRVSAHAAVGDISSDIVAVPCSLVTEQPLPYRSHPAAVLLISTSTTLSATFLLTSSLYLAHPSKLQVALVRRSVIFLLRLWSLYELLSARLA